MTTKGKSWKLNEEHAENRRNAPRKHGAYAIQDRGEGAMDGKQRGLYAELQEQLSTPEGVRQAMIDQAAQSLVLYRAATSYISQQNKQGVPLDQIALLNRIPAFQNSAARQLSALLVAMPGPGSDNSDVIELIEKYRGDNEKDS